MKTIIKRLVANEIDYPEELEQPYHRNCAEVVMLAANEKYNMNLDERFLKAVFPFGGGMQFGKSCGALCGAVACIGIMFAEDQPTQNRKVKKLTKEYVQKFESCFGFTDCVYLKANSDNSQNPCLHIKLQSADLLDQLIQEKKALP